MCRSNATQEIFLGSSILVFDFWRLLVCSWLYFWRGSQTFCQTSVSSIMEVADMWNSFSGSRLRQYSAICSMYAVTDFQVLLMKVQIGQSCAYKPFSAIGHGKAIDHVLRRRWWVPIKSLVGVLVLLLTGY